ncbi:hypothetical protein EVG20_g9185 [Dentipellis fragilis]|uniref:Glycoside hydrolase family 71 protein n=1 Tax=Dentipellis fragilis TaxID=205917 RepID=A0A4Y9Y161_9AGAM|nr:hypothetical protein EVG20_g9185 [Dentipellis fragilis]
MNAACRDLGSGFERSVIPAQNPEDVDHLRKYVELLARHPNQMLCEGKVLISTFAGDQARFGFSSINEAWTFVKAELSKIAPIHLVPAFFVDPATYPSLSSIDGIFHWNGGWPLHLTTQCSREEIRRPALDSDKHHLAHLHQKTYIAGVSPWFFTHYGPDSWNKNWIYRGDDWLLVRRWEYLLSQRNHIDIVQLISWNDYGESHYVAPVRGAQPNSQAWVDGFPHEPWMLLNAYYARAFKEGRMPPIEKDRIFMWARPHPKTAQASEDEVPRPDGWQLTEDLFWVVLFATTAATAILSSGDDAPVKYEIKGGVTKLAGKLVPGRGMWAQITRGGAIVAECAPSLDEYRFEAGPRVYNFNAYVAMSR